MRTTLCIALITLATAWLPAIAGTNVSDNPGVHIGSGSWLEARCPADTSDVGKYQSGMCIGYVLGVLGGERRGRRVGAALVLNATSRTIGKSRANRLWKIIYSHDQYCIPKGVTNGQIVFVVKKYLHNHPAEWQKSGATLIIEALGRAWPCSD